MMRMKRELPFMHSYLHLKSDNVDEFTNGEYIHAGLAFTSEQQLEYEKNAKEWWQKYKSNFE